MTPLVIVCGPPAAGKTTLATALSTQLRLPIVSKDALKEALMDHLGGSPAVGAAAFAVQFAMARELLRAGVGLILEGAFFVDQAELADIACLGDALVLRLDCPLDVLEKRYVDRLGARHHPIAASRRCPTSADECGPAHTIHQTFNGPRSESTHLMASIQRKRRSLGGFVRDLLKERGRKASPRSDGSRVPQRTLA